VIKTVEAWQTLNDDDSQEKHSLIYLTATDRADLIAAIDGWMTVPKNRFSPRMTRMQGYLRTLQGTK
jgi:hypothetical protein